jgi:hypothetical protein
MQDKRTWRTSSHSGGQGNCVEVAIDTPGRVSVRDSKNRGAAELTFSHQAWHQFTSSVKQARFPGYLDQIRTR